MCYLQMQADMLGHVFDTIENTYVQGKRNQTIASYYIYEWIV